MRNFQSVIFIRTRTYKEIFKSALVSFNDIAVCHLLTDICIGNFFSDHLMFLLGYTTNLRYKGLD